MKKAAFGLGFLGAACCAAFAAWYLRWSYQQFDRQE